MDYLQKAIDKFRADKIEAKNLPFCEIIKPMDVDWRKANSRLYNKVYEIINKIKGMRENIQSAYVSKNMLFKRFFFATLGGTIGAAIIGIWIKFTRKIISYIM